MSASCVIKQFVNEGNTAGNVAPSLQPATAKAAAIQFSMFKNTEVERQSHVQVVNRSLYDVNVTTQRSPMVHGCLDPRLGTSDKRGTCRTCGKGLVDCIGHFGHIKLELPCFHIGYFKEAVRILQCICKSCSRVLLKPADRKRYLAKVRNPRLDRLTRAEITRGKILDDCKKVKTCPHCQAINGPVKKITGVYKLIHDLKNVKIAADLVEEWRSEFDVAEKFNKQVTDHMGKSHFMLDPLTVLGLFREIPDEDCDLLNLNRKRGRPEDMLITSMAVPPVCMRPSVTMGTSGTNEDDLTMKLGDIVYINDVIRMAFEKGAATSVIMENWDFLQQQVAMYINSDLPGFPKIQGNVKPIRGLTQRLKGKTGRFRGNLSGKRVDFSARTVISPDPNLRVDQVGVPRLVAMRMTYPDRVNEHNREMLQRAVMNGPNVHPGANFIEFSTGAKIFLKYGDREKIASMLKLGDIVERHLHDGDIVLFNRQPSLHKMSIMSHRAKVLESRTFRFNECVCNPYNADFDGDEMNLHLPQTEEARAEAITLMGVEQNLVTPRHAEPLVCATQDFLTSAYLISNKDVFFNRSKFCQMVGYLSDANELVELPPPAIYKPVQMWTGKQVFSMMMRPNKKSDLFAAVSLELKARNYIGNDILCPRDGYVVIRNSELLCGNLCKTALGGSKVGLFYTLIRDYSPYHAARCMNRLAKLSARFIGNRGFSIGINDVTPSPRLNELKAELCNTGYKNCGDNIIKYKKGLLEAAAGCNEEETLEATLLGELSQIREDAGASCLAELDYNYNAPLIMAVCGSKGSKINISQMVACVGQQAVGGKRIANGFVNRTLPHFAKFSREPFAKGFVENSFYTGLTATEFFFHTMGGREGLVDTAVKTAETGYMQRRLVKALEDLSVCYDGSVRTAQSHVVQFNYGDDGLDPVMMAKGVQPVNFAHMWDYVRALHPVCEAHPCVPTSKARKLSNVLDSVWYRDGVSDRFVQEVKDFAMLYLDNLDVRAAKLAQEVGISVRDAMECVQQGDPVTMQQLREFFKMCKERFMRAVVEPGTAVGAVAAQSIGEPGTQMTLKTFHFAGVASMNVTLGVPRIKEIINAAKTISSPIIDAPLENNKDEKSARIVKGRIEKTTLGEIAEYIEQVLSQGQCYVSVKLDLEAIEALQLSITVESVRDALTTSLKLKNPCQMRGEDQLRVYPNDTTKEGMLYDLQNLMTKLSAVDVCGIKDVNRAVINTGSGNKLNLIVEGTNLLGVMGTVGVVGKEVTSNHIMRVEDVLGIEAARTTIIKEIQTTMGGHGLTVDYRHVTLLADIMTYRGKILGITRFGMAKMKESVLMLASFEQTSDHLFEAAMRGTGDNIAGVSECIIMGVPIPVGTGMFDMLYKDAPAPAAEEKEEQKEQQQQQPSAQLLLAGV